MKKNILALLAVLLVVAGLSAQQGALTPSQDYGNDWGRGGLLSNGDVHVTSGSVNEVLQAQQPLTVGGKSVQFQVSVEADHRWVRYDPLQADVEGRTINLKLQTWHYALPHIENYVPSLAQSSVVELTGLNGRYEVQLAGSHRGFITVKTSSS